MLNTVGDALNTRCCGPEGCGRRGSYNERFCLADCCMAWRWAYKAKEGSPTGLFPDPPIKYERLDKGYCGLAGHCQVD